MSKIAVLVVSYRRADLLERCLDSVGRWLPHAPTFVWDNHSDGSSRVREVADRRPEITWHFSSENLGFAAAVNGLARLVVGDSDLLLLNPDAELLGDLDATRARLHEPDVAAAAPMICGDLGNNWDNAHREPTLVRALVSYVGNPSRRRWPPRLTDLYAEPPREGVGYLTGSCLLVKRGAWDDVGPFDERYFVYSEEADWAARARSRGWRLALAGEVGARHASGGTVADDPTRAARSAALMRDGQVRYLRDHHGALKAHTYLIGTAALSRLQRSKRGPREASGQASTVPSTGGGQ